MGLTAIDGLPMGTHTGALDPGVVLYLMDELGMDARDRAASLPRVRAPRRVGRVLRHANAARLQRPACGFRDHVFCYRISRELGSLAAALSGIGALVFTGGIGEHATPVRERVLRAAAWLGLDLDAAADARHGPRLTAAASRASAWAIPTDEALMIARHVQAMLAAR